MTARTLTLILAVQLLLAGITWWPADRSASLPHPLLDVEPAQISALAIAAKPVDDEALQWLELERDGEGWTIASRNDYPADTAKVTTVIDALSALEVRRPIASRKSSHNALGVGDDEWGRRVRLTLDGEARELVVGAAQSNSVNVRFADEDDVYVASGLSEWTLRDDARSYWNPLYVQAPVQEIDELRVQNANGTLHFVRDGETWRFNEPREGEAGETGVIADFVGAVTRLRLDEPVGAEALPEHGLDGSIRVGWTIESENESVGGGYVIGAETDDNRYVKSDNSAFVVAIPASSLSRALEATRDEFVVAPAPSELAPPLE